MLLLLLCVALSGCRTPCQRCALRFVVDPDVLVQDFAICSSILGPTTGGVRVVGRHPWSKRDGTPPFTSGVLKTGQTLHATNCSGYGPTVTYTLRMANQTEAIMCADVDGQGILIRIPYTRHTPDAEQEPGP